MPLKCRYIRMQSCSLTAANSIWCIGSYNRAVCSVYFRTLIIYATYTNVLLPYENRLLHLIYSRLSEKNCHDINTLDLCLRHPHLCECFSHWVRRLFLWVWFVLGYTFVACQHTQSRKEFRKRCRTNCILWQTLGQHCEMRLEKFCQWSM